ncbi:hypothetical protein V8F06_007881 [Rhypophila decipiens]
MSMPMQFVGRTRPQQLQRQYTAPRSTGRPRTRKIESFRRGYPRLAAFINSDRDFVMFRSFGALHARILLHKQDELIELESNIEEVDQQENTEYFLATRREDRNERRRLLLLQAEQRLYEYILDKLLESYYKNIDRPRPSDNRVKNVDNWMDGTKPLVQAESTFLDDWDDLRAPNSHDDHGGLDIFLETWAYMLTKRGGKKLFSHPSDRSKSDDDNVILFDPSRVIAASRFITTAFAIVSLTIPIVVLYNIAAITTRLWTIAVFTAIFSSTLCWLMQSRKYEIMTATAAYCAVMVVFVGNLPV